MLVTHINAGKTLPYYSYGCRDWVELAIKFLLANNVPISDSGSTGGYLSIFKIDSDKNPLLDMTIICGNFSQEKNESYLSFSLEKAIRLSSNFEKGHKTSRQSANNKNKEYPGAIYIKEIKTIFSFSGLKPEWDEFLSALVSCRYYLSLSSWGGIPNGKTYKLEDIVKLFNKRSNLITATEEQKAIMTSVVQGIVNEEISSATIAH